MPCPDYPLYQSQQCRYFIGQTPVLTGTNTHALATLVNPIHSNVTLYLNAITVTNISSLNVSAEIYLSPTLTPGTLSSSVSCTNFSCTPLPSPKGEIRYLSTTPTPPSTGVDVFGRIIPSYSTTVIDGSQIILGPGKSLLVYLGGYLPITLNSIIVAFGWWEEPIYDLDCAY